ISDAAKRGFAVFVGRGMCSECHSGPLFSDLEDHDTGVDQSGPGVPPIDLGRGAITNKDDNGKFLTGPLRQIASTGPYMHDGWLGSLGDVIQFYRQGGVTGSYSGTRDARIVPADMTDDDAADLEVFLGTLTGAAVPKLFLTPPGVCWGVQVDLTRDAQHCGS